MFTLQTRDFPHYESFQTLELALAAGFSLRTFGGPRRAFDVSSPSGAIVWAWEQRDDQPAQQLAEAA